VAGPEAGPAESVSSCAVKAGARLDAGDPHGEVTTPLQIALSHLDDPPPRNLCCRVDRGAAAVSDPGAGALAASCPLACRVGRALRPVGRVDRAERKLQREDQEHRAEAPRLPDFDNCRLLPNHARTREDRLGRESEPAPGSLRRETLVGEGAWDGCLSVEAWQSRSRCSPTGPRQGLDSLRKPWAVARTAPIDVRSERWPGSSISRAAPSVPSKAKIAPVPVMVTPAWAGRSTVRRNAVSGHHSRARNGAGMIHSPGSGCMPSTTPTHRRHAHADLILSIDPGGGAVLLPLCCAPVGAERSAGRAPAGLRGWWLCSHDGAGE
jgi:hypothetical protein